MDKLGKRTTCVPEGQDRELQEFIVLLKWPTSQNIVYFWNLPPNIFGATDYDKQNIGILKALLSSCWHSGFPGAPGRCCVQSCVLRG